MMFSTETSARKGSQKNVYFHLEENIVRCFYKFHFPSIIPYNFLIFLNFQILCSCKNHNFRKNKKWNMIYFVPGVIKNKKNKLFKYLIRFHEFSVKTLGRKIVKKQLSSIEIS